MNAPGPEPSFWRRHRRLLAGLLLLGAAVGLAWAPRWQEQQPVYAGRTVMEWAADVTSADPARATDARAALVALGPRAVPTLIRNLRRRDPFLDGPLLAASYRVSPGLSLSLARWMNAGASAAARRQALDALAVLGPTADSAIPALGRIIRTPPQPRRFAEWIQAVHVLGRMGPAARVSLVDALPGAPDPLQPHLFAALARLGPAAVDAIPSVLALFTRQPDREWRGLTGFLEAVGVEALPGLYALLEDPDPLVRDRVAGILDEMAQTRPAVREAMVAACPALPPTTRLELVKALGRLGSLHPAVARLMMRALEDPDAAVRAAGVHWLRRRLSPAQLDRLVAGEPPAVQARVRAQVGAEPDLSPAPPR